MGGRMGGVGEGEGGRVARRSAPAAAPGIRLPAQSEREASVPATRARGRRSSASASQPPPAEPTSCRRRGQRQPTRCRCAGAACRRRQKAPRLHVAASAHRESHARASARPDAVPTRPRPALAPPLPGRSVRHGDSGAAFDTERTARVRGHAEVPMSCLSRRLCVRVPCPPWRLEARVLLLVLLMGRRQGRLESQHGHKTAG